MGLIVLGAPHPLFKLRAIIVRPLGTEIIASSPDWAPLLGLLLIGGPSRFLLVCYCLKKA